jgi:hypothetical protein
LTTPESPEQRGLLARLLSADARFLQRLAAVFQLDSRVYAEIDSDPSTIPQAFAVVILTAVVAGLGQGSIAYLFLSTAVLILNWLMAAALVWGVGTLVVGDRSDYARLLRCLGFAYAWFGLLLFENVAWLGNLVRLASVGLCLASFVQATRQVLAVETQVAAAICGAGLLGPYLLLQILL